MNYYFARWFEASLWAALPATVLLWGAEGSSGFAPEVPEAEVLNVKC